MTLFRIFVHVKFESWFQCGLFSYLSVLFSWLKNESCFTLCWQHLPLNLTKGPVSHLFSDNVTHMRSTNRKPQPSNQFPMDKIKSHPTFFSFFLSFTRIYVAIEWCRCEVTLAKTLFRFHHPEVDGFFKWDFG